MNRFALSAAGLLAALIVFAISPSDASASHSWANYHWARTANPFALQLGDNVSGNWDPSLAGTSADWSASSVLNTSVVAGSANPKNCRPRAGRVEVCNSKYGNNGWLGIAQIWASGSHITQGVVKLNDTYFNTGTYNTPEWRNFVVCQEVGHTFGLDHQDENFNNQNLGSCMDYTRAPSTNQSPNQHDYDQLDAIYAHADSTTTVGSGVPSGPGNSDLNSPGEWGRLVSQSANGKAATFERDLGNGQKLITYVDYAD